MLQPTETRKIGHVKAERAGNMWLISRSPGTADRLDATMKTRCVTVVLMDLISALSHMQHIKFNITGLLWYQTGFKLSTAAQPPLGAFSRLLVDIFTPSTLAKFTSINS